MLRPLVDDLRTAGEPPRGNPKVSPIPGFRDQASAVSAALRDHVLKVKGDARRSMVRATDQMTPLLEREREAERLDAALADTAKGHGCLVVVSGGAGLGKSRLLDFAYQRCRELGIQALTARGEELEVTLPWSVARQLLDPVLSRATPRQRQKLFEGAAAPAAALLEPGASSPADGAVGEGLLPLVHALFWVLDGIATSSPTALVVDDAHWGDEPSLRLLAYLARRVPDLPLAVVIACRPRPSSPERGPLDELLADPGTRRLELRPLSLEAASTLAREALAADATTELVDACVEVTGGNPFYLRELLRSLEAQTDGRATSSEVRALAPAAVSRSLFLRLSRLGADAGALARAAAVLGDRAALPHAAELAGLELATAARSLDQLAAAEILMADEPLRFIHPLVATAVHDDIPPAALAELHLRAARILDRDGVESALLAPHLLAAGCRGDPWVVEKLRLAARAAASQGGAPGAARYLARALDEPPPVDERAELLAELGRVESALGRPGAPERLRAAVELTGPGERRARLLLDLGRALVVGGSHVEAAEHSRPGSRRPSAPTPSSPVSCALHGGWPPAPTGPSGHASPRPMSPRSTTAPCRPSASASCSPSARRSTRSPADPPRR